MCNAIREFFILIWITIFCIVTVIVVKYRLVDLVKRISINYFSILLSCYFQIRWVRREKPVVQRFEIIIIISTDYGRAAGSIVRGNGEGTVSGEERNFNFRKLIYFHLRSPRLIASQTPPPPPPLPPLSRFKASALEIRGSFLSLGKPSNRPSLPPPRNLCVGEYCFS